MAEENSLGFLCPQLGFYKLRGLQVSRVCPEGLWVTTSSAQVVLPS